MPTIDRTSGKPLSRGTLIFPSDPPEPEPLPDLGSDAFLREISREISAYLAFWRIVREEPCK
jgi:hypothetical protein